MDHINLFQTEAEFLSAYNGSDYVEPWVSYTRENSGVSYNKAVQPHDYSQDYLTFEFLGNGSGTISCEADGVSYSLDGENWSEFKNEVSVNGGDKMLIKGNLKTTWSLTYGVFITTGCPNFNVYGNIMSIYDSTNFKTLTSFSDTGHSLGFLFLRCPIISAENLILPATTLTEYCYNQMFYDCSSLTTAPELPATTLGVGCYNYMFNGCTSLTTAPELPATTLADSCYSGMFQGCTGLTTAPSILPATTLLQNCYYSMFYGCTNLNYIKCLATDISAYDCTGYWVYGVASSGTFVKNPNMSSWTTGVNGIPNGWDVQDA